MKDKEKRGRGSNPKSRENLVPIKPGEVLNPEGGRAHDAAKRGLVQLTCEHMRELLNIVVMGNLADLEELANHPDTPNIQRAAAYCFEKAMREKDWDLIEKMITRIVGKVPDKIDHTSDGKALPGGPIQIEFVKVKPDATPTDS